MSTIFIAIGAAFALLFVFGLWLKRSFRRMIDERFERASSKAVRENLQAILTLAGSSFDEKLKQVRDVLGDKEQEFRKLVAEVGTQVRDYQQEIRIIARDHSQISTTLSEQKQAVSTLAKVLHTNNLRGQWGERIAEDILKSAGLMEGLHYERNQQMETSANRPDFTIRLPDGHKLNVDVKFPISNFVRAQEADDPAEQKRCLKDFEGDVKRRVDEIAKKEYINPDEQTVDFAIMFVPNESVYSAIHTYCRNVIDIAEEKHVVLAAPFSLIAIVRLVQQAFRHFHYEQSIRNVVADIERLRQDLDLFQGRFVEFGAQIEKLLKLYQQIADTSFQRISSRIEKIERYQQGGESKAEALTDQSV